MLGSPSGVVEEQHRTAPTSGDRSISPSSQRAAGNRHKATERLHRDLLTAEVQSARSFAFVGDSASFATDVDRDESDVQFRDRHHIGEVIATAMRVTH